jgi:DNA-binding beta-propeller fold protein YncE
MRKTTLIILTLLISAGFQPMQAQTKWEVTKTFHLGGQGEWDYLILDPHTHRLFVPRSTHTMVIDADSGKVLGDIPGQKIAHGVALAPEVGRGFISDGGGHGVEHGAIVVFDLKTYAVLGTIVAQPDADGIIYDPAIGRVLVVSGDKGVLMSFKPDIDPVHGTIDAPIDLGGSPEFLASDGKGKVYINLMDKNEVAVVDLGAKKVIARWPVAPGGAPVGMSIDKEKGLLFIGCRKPQKLIVMKTDDGKVISALPIGGNVDATKHDKHQAFASCGGDGTLSVASEKSPGNFGVDQVVKTLRGARTMELDAATHRIFLPTAEFDPPKPGGTGRLAPKPGTFMIVVVEGHAQQAEPSTKTGN